MPLVRQFRAFTLIELLAVVVVIAALSAILLQGVMTVREHADRAKCASQIRGISQAMQFYVSEHDGFFPAAADQRSNGTGIWSWSLVNSGYIPPLWKGWVCPTHVSNDRIVGERLGTANANTYPRSYAICGTLLGSVGGDYTSPYQSPVNIRDISSPGNFVVLSEWHASQSGVRWAAKGDPTTGTTLERDRIRAAAENSDSPNSLVYHPRRSRHFAFADGHIRWMTAEEAAQGQYWER